MLDTRFTSCSVRQQEGETQERVSRDMELPIQSQREALRRTSPVEVRRARLRGSGRSQPRHHTRRGRTQRILFRRFSIVLNKRRSRVTFRHHQRRIQRAAAQLGYRPTCLRARCAGGAAYRWRHGFHMTDPYCTLVLRGIENTLYQSSFLPILTDVHNERSRFERYLEMLLTGASRARRPRQLVVRRHRLAGRSGEAQHSTAVVGRELKNETSARDRRHNLGAERRLTICIRWAIVRSRLSAVRASVGHNAMRGVRTMR